MGEGKYRLEGGNITRRGGDIVDEYATVGLGTELVIELETVIRQCQVKMLVTSLVRTGCPFAAHACKSRSSP